MCILIALLSLRIPFSVEMFESRGTSVLAFWVLSLGFLASPCFSHSWRHSFNAYARISNIKTLSCAEMEIIPPSYKYTVAFSPKVILHPDRQIAYMCGKALRGIFWGTIASSPKKLNLWETGRRIFDSGLRDEYIHFRNMCTLSEESLYGSPS